MTRFARTISGPGATGIVVTGERGMGKTTLMRDVLAGLQGGVVWTKIATSPALAAVRYGTLAPFLDSSGDHTDSDEGILRSLREALGTERGYPSRQIVVVDDAHHLDTASAVLLGQLVATNSLTLFALSNPGSALPRALRTLCMEGVMERVDLEPLSAIAARDFSESILGGPVSPTSSVLLWKTSGGLPLALSALVHHNRARGILALRGGVWRLTDQPSLRGTELTDLVRDRLRNVPPAGVAVLEMLALAGPMPYSWVLDGIETHHLAMLEDEGLITVGTGQESTVSITSPLYTQLIRNLVPHGRSAALFGRARELRQRAPGGGDSGQTVSSVDWALSCGEPVPQSDLVTAARTANASYQPHLAARFASAVSAPEYRVQARIQTSQANYLLGISDGSVLERALELAPDMTTATEAAVCAARFTQQRGQHPEQVQAIARRWARTASRVSAQDGSRDGTPADHEARIRSLELYGLNLAARYSESEPALQELSNGPLGSNEDRFFSRVLLGESLGARGRPRTGAAVLDSAVQMMATADRLPSGHREFALLHGALCAIFSGEWDELDGMIAGYVSDSTASLVYFGAALELIDGFKDLRRGALTRATSNLASAVEGLQTFDPYQLRPLALGLAAYAGSLVGDRDATAAYLSRFERREYDGGRQLLLLAEAYAGAARGALSPDAGALTDLRRLRAEASEAGLVSVEMHTVELSIRSGDLSGIGRLIDLSAAAEGTEARVLNLYAVALHSGRQQKLIAAAEEAGSAGYSLLAVDGAARAIRAVKENGSNAGLARAYQALRTYQAHTDNIELPSTHQPADLPKLSPSELRVVQLVAQGVSNGDVAAQLCVSVRTVEGHLYRVYKKMGITRRDELTPALVSVIERDRR